jgi:competence protein ComGC
MMLIVEVLLLLLLLLSVPQLSQHCIGVVFYGCSCVVQGSNAHRVR